MGRARRAEADRPADAILVELGAHTSGSTAARDRRAIRSRLNGKRFRLRLSPAAF
ncbi:hypothetical protein ABZ027_37235 [Streptomyces sp. NPDC006332]|uniref:hypothetical protein n=1 Tax=Streptomyces sp. NPDC006332 TaxID=3155456 RepID=UPI00339F2C0C